MEVVHAEQAQVHRARRRGGLAGRRVGSRVEAEQGYRQRSGEGGEPGEQMPWVPQTKTTCSNVRPPGRPVLLNGLIGRVKRV